MRYSLLDNGVDSLKATYISIEKMHALHDGTGMEHCLKDAVLSLNHGIEILFKLLLRQRNEYLVFSDLDKYMVAKKKMIEQGKTNIFEVAPNLRTVTLNEAMDRAEFLCEYEVDSTYKKVITFINKIRNQLTHYEINMKSPEMLELSVKIQTCYELTIHFFAPHIEGLEEKVEAARFEYTVDDYATDMGEWYAEVEMEERMLERMLERYDT
ncbi:hypothetical protein [Brevibacillus sp. HB2.2]|uniref:hypothetical protein n=1 Tax=Brevibacillus sp. HB2.2 TaxID=2738846 RepID=UPI00156A8BF9|nr:hypothetical protein [Brevibacillus sp. HB2.2]NRS52147.1 hypothetical protein [Brevibacillus sp. HB2.2]